MLHWGVYFIIFSVVFRELGTIHVAGITLNQFIIIFLFFLALLAKLLRKQEVFKLVGLDIALLAFGAYLWISNYFVSENPNWGIRYSSSYFRSLACYFLVIFLIDSRLKIKIFIASYILASLIMVFTADFYTAISSGLDFSIYNGRTGLDGLSGHYIKYAQYALMSVPLSYYAFRNADRKLKPIIFIVILILCLAALFSGSRGAILTFVMIFSVIAVTEIHPFDQMDSKNFIFISLLGLTLFLVFWFKGGSELLGSLISPIKGGPMDSSLAGRVYINKQAFSIFLENPIFGVGIDSTRNHFTHIPHNQWLQILTELGLFGMSLAAIILYKLYNTFSTDRTAFQITNDLPMLNYASGAMISVFAMFFWGFYENIGLISAEKFHFMLFGLSRSIEMVASKSEA